ncbi:MAG: hypothetical protein M9907_04005 [Burkholderiaceae bacterium]|nr:hypothetical protein [Burkholderiaceae bacterium]
MAPAKTSTLTLRVEPAFKDALRVAAEGEHRSISNMVEGLIRDYCRVHGIRIPDASAASPPMPRRPRRAEDRSAGRRQPEEIVS